MSLTDIPVYNPGDRGLYPGLLTDIQGNSVAYRSLYTLLVSDTLLDLYTPSVYPKLLTDTTGYNVAGRSSNNLLLTDILVYTPSYLISLSTLCGQPIFTGLYFR